MSNGGGGSAGLTSCALLRFSDRAMTPGLICGSTKQAGSACAARLCARSGARPATYARFTKPGRRSAVTISRGRPVRFARSYDRPATTRDQDGLMEAVGEAVRVGFLSSENISGRRSAIDKRTTRRRALPRACASAGGSRRRSDRSKRRRAAPDQAQRARQGGLGVHLVAAADNLVRLPKLIGAMI